MIYDRYGDPIEESVDQTPDEVWSAEQRRLYAITQCELCNDDGQRPDFTRCNHIDFREAAERGIALCREVLRATGKPKDTGHE